ncbi:MAG: hypothetical protein AB1791_13505 [Chloroflexota bacterium]
MQPGHRNTDGYSAAFAVPHPYSYTLTVAIRFTHLNPSTAHTYPDTSITHIFTFDNTHSDPRTPALAGHGPLPHRYAGLRGI